MEVQSFSSCSVSPPVSCLSFSLSLLLSVMFKYQACILSTTLSSLGFNSKHGYPSRALSMPTPLLSLVLQLLALHCRPVGRGTHRKTWREKEQKGSEGKASGERNKPPFQLCFCNKESRENFFTLKNFPLFSKGRITFDIFGQYYLSVLDLAISQLFILKGQQQYQFIFEKSLFLCFAASNESLQLFI